MQADHTHCGYRKAEKKKQNKTEQNRTKQNQTKKIGFVELIFQLVSFLLQFTLRRCWYLLKFLTHFYQKPFKFYKIASIHKFVRLSH